MLRNYKVNLKESTQIGKTFPDSTPPRHFEAVSIEVTVDGAAKKAKKRAIAESGFKAPKVLNLVRI
jgi:hypothetical protein